MVLLHDFPLVLDLAQTAALVLTLIFLIWYTISTHKLVSLQREEVGLQKKPVVSFWCEPPRQLRFNTKYRNFSNVPAKVRIKATIIVDGKHLSLPDEHHYSGHRVWRMQAMGNFGLTGEGHMDLEKYLEQQFPTPSGKSITHKNITVTVEIWCANAEEGDSVLKLKENKLPIAQWYWLAKEPEAWTHEISPEFFDFHGHKEPIVH